MIADGVIHLGVSEQREYCIDNCGPPKSYTDYLYTLDARTGKEIRKIQTKIPISSLPRHDDALIPILDNGVIYTSRLDSVLYAVNAQSGETIWKFDGGSYIYASPVLSDG